MLPFAARQASMPADGSRDQKKLGGVNMRKGPILLMAVLTIFYLGFLVWYGGAGKPLDQAEVEQRIAALVAATKAKGLSPDEHLLTSIRSLGASDDGGEFFNVNLIKYREKALYPPELQAIYGDDARAADARYSRAIIPLVLKHGGFPILYSEYQGRFLHPEGASDWDVVAIVRYRSRRDMMAMMQAIAESPEDVAVHKWASIERTHVFPVKPKFDFVMVRLTVFVAVVVLGVVLHLILGLLPAYRRKQS